MEKAYKRLVNLITKRTGSLILSVALICNINLASAQEIRLISDEETEKLLALITQPLFEVAELHFNPNELYIVDDDSLNAFVADGNKLFIHSGTITAADSANELAGVIAHETGHIYGGHILRQKIQNKSMQKVSMLSALAAGTAAAISGRSDVAVAAVLGSQSSMLHHYLYYRTTEERAADEAALKFLQATNQSPRGMLNFMKRINKSLPLQGIEENPYFRTHPITVERISFFEQAVKNSNLTPNDKWQNEFDKVKAKLFAYLNSPAQTRLRYPKSDKSVAAQYARAIADFKQLKIKSALETMRQLTLAEPDNPYFYELKGQINQTTGNIKQAKKDLQKALQLAPEATAIQLLWAQTVLEDAPSADELGQLVKVLNKALIKRPSAYGWLLLARVYGLQENIAGANYASAEYSLGIGEYKTALNQLKNALNAKPNPQLRLKIRDLQNKIDNLLKK